MKIRDKELISEATEALRLIVNNTTVPEIYTDTLSEIITRYKARVEQPHDAAETYYIDHPKAGWAIFCFNTKGDLFLNCDWGFYGFAWRAFGTKTFKEFLTNLNAEYIAGKFSINYNTTNKRPLLQNTVRFEQITSLIDSFLEEIKEHPAKKIIP